MNLTWLNSQRLEISRLQARAEELFKTAQTDADNIRANSDLSEAARENRLKGLSETAANAIRDMVTKGQAIGEAVAAQARFWADPLMNFKTTHLLDPKPGDLAAILAETNSLPDGTVPLAFDSAIEMQDWPRAYCLALRNANCAASLPQNSDTRDIVSVVQGSVASLEHIWHMVLTIPNAPGVSVHTAAGMERGFTVAAGKAAGERLGGNAPQGSYAADMAAKAPQRPTA